MELLDSQINLEEPGMLNTQVLFLLRKGCMTFYAHHMSDGSASGRLTRIPSNRVSPASRLG